MDIEKLIERLKSDAADWAGDRYIKQDLLDAVEALATLQIELKAMRGAANSYKAENARLESELEKVKAERDAYKIYFDDLSSKPDCNTCDDRDCRYRPRAGDTVRVNCPLWRGKKEE